MTVDYKNFLFFFVIACLLLQIVNYLTNNNVDYLPQDYHNYLKNFNSDDIPIFSKFFFSFFVPNTQWLFIWIGILAALIIPVLLYLKAKHFSIVWLYFLAINYFWATTYLGLFSQLCLTVVLLIYLLRENLIEKLIIVFSATLFHNFGILLMLTIFIIDLIIYQIFEKKIFNKLLFCALPLVKTDNYFTKTNIGLGLSLQNVLNFFSTGFPLPFFLAAIYGLWIKNKKILCYGITLIISALLLPGLGERLLLFSEIFFLFGLSYSYENCNNIITKKAIFIFSVLILYFNFISWLFGFLKMNGAC